MTDAAKQESVTVTRDILDEDDEVYQFAGRLLGTRWKFPNGRISKVEKVARTHETHEGQKMPYPELRFDHGPRIPAQGFRRRIHPDMDGDVKPDGDLAAQIVGVLRDNY